MEMQSYHAIYMGTFLFNIGLLRMFFELTYTREQLINYDHKSVNLGSV